MTDKSTVPINIYRRRLDGLCRLRFDTCFLPDTIEGRNMLIALLRFGLTDEGAAEQAPWGEAELSTLKRRARRMKWHDVGRLIGLTFVEWKEARLWVLRPIDASEQDIKDWRKNQRKKNDAERKRKKRESDRKQKQAKLAKADLEHNPIQATAVEKILIENDHPMPVAEIMKEARKSFRYDFPRPRHNERRADASLRSAVHRALDHLEKKGAVLTDKRRKGRWAFIPTESVYTVYAADFGRNVDLPRVFAKIGVSASLGSGHDVPTPPTPTDQAEQHSRGGLVIAFPTPASTNAEPVRKAA
jgi:hypothetical protein